MTCVYLSKIIVFSSELVKCYYYFSKINEYNIEIVEEKLVLIPFKEGYRPTAWQSMK